MKNVFKVSKVFESNVRLQIIASLYKGDLSYKQLKEICNCTDGNMATHLNKLIQNDFILKHKTIYNDKPLTTYHLSDFGRNEFQNYVALLQEAINMEGEENEEETYNNSESAISSFSV